MNHRNKRFNLSRHNLKQRAHTAKGCSSLQGLARGTCWRSHHRFLWRDGQSRSRWVQVDLLTSCCQLLSGCCSWTAGPELAAAWQVTSASASKCRLDCNQNKLVEI